jgi:alpha-galactosidase
VNLSALGLNGSCKVRDLWNHLETDTVSGVLKISLPAHGAGLYRVSPI